MHSLTSTTLVSLPLLHGMPSFSMAARYTSMLPYPHNELARIVAKAIPQLDEIDTRVSGRQMNPLAAGDAPEPTSVNIEYPVESVH